MGGKSTSTSPIGIVLRPTPRRLAKMKGLDAIKKVFAWGKNKKAAGAKKLAEGAKKFAELKAAAEKAAAAKKGSNQDEDLEDEPNMERAAKKKGLAELKAAVEKAAAAAKKG